MQTRLPTELAAATAATALRCVVFLLEFHVCPVGIWIHVLFFTHKNREIFSIFTVRLRCPQRIQWTNTNPPQCQCQIVSFTFRLVFCFCFFAFSDQLPAHFSVDILLCTEHSIRTFRVSAQLNWFLNIFISPFTAAAAAARRTKKIAGYFSWCEYQYEPCSAQQNLYMHSVFTRFLYFWIFLFHAVSPIVRTNSTKLSNKLKTTFAHDNAKVFQQMVRQCKHT